MSSSQCSFHHIMLLRLSYAQMSSHHSVHNHPQPVLYLRIRDRLYIVSFEILRTANIKATVLWNVIRIVW
jgi:hypothetical protein